MPKLSITEFRSYASDAMGGPAPAPQMPALKEQWVEIGKDSKPSEPFGLKTLNVMIHAPVACHLAFGKDPVAEKDKHEIGAGETRFYGVNAGDSVAVMED